MPSIEQAAGALGPEVTGNERVGCVHHAIIDQARKRVASAKRKSVCKQSERSTTPSETLTQLHGHSAVETIAGGDELLELATTRIRS